MSQSVQIDLVQGGQGFGDVAGRLLAHNFNVNALRPLTTLRQDEWKAYDDTVIEVAQRNFRGIADLRSAGLVFNLPNALGRTILEWDRVGDMEDAEVSMAGVTQGQNDRIEFDRESMPIPIVHKEFTLNIRALAASRNSGEGLDVTQAAYSTRKVIEKLENILILGTSVMGASKPLYGYTSFPRRLTGSLTANWTTATGEQIVADIMRGVNLLQLNNNNMFGPYVIYVSSADMLALSRDYKAESDKTILSRAKEIPGVQDIRALPNLATGNVLFIQLTRDVVDLINGLAPTMVQWDELGGFVKKFKILAIMPPRLKATMTNQVGIVHFSI